MGGIIILEFIAMCLKSVPRSGRVWLMVMLTTVAGSALGQPDLTPLFSPSTPAEIAAVEADWSARSTQGTNFTVERTALVNGFTMARVSFQFDGLTQYGFLRYPRDHDPTGDFPVMVLHHGGDSGLYYGWVGDFDQDWPGGCVADSFFVLAPTYRSEACNGSSVLGIKLSEGAPSLWDRDCDDAMAMLRAFLNTEPTADTGRIFSVGRSRGALVAYQQALRDPLIQRSVILFGASDFRHPDILADCQVEVDGGPVATNGLSSRVMTHILQPWLDGTLTLTEARLQMCRWSILQHLRADVPLQLHHGLLDPEIPIQHAEWVEAEMAALGASQPAFEFFPYPQAAHGTDGMTELGLRVEPYICDNAGEVSAVDTPPLRPELRAWPNPFQGQVDIRLSGSDADKTRGLAPILEILDVRGRVVRSLSMEAGLARWDGRTAAGRIVPAGVYLARTRLSGRPVEGSGAPPLLKLLVLH